MGHIEEMQSRSIAHGLMASVGCEIIFRSSCEILNDCARQFNQSIQLPLSLALVWSSLFSGQAGLLLLMIVFQISFLTFFSSTNFS